MGFVGYRTFSQDFRTTVSGVTRQNIDGTNRQDILKTLRPGEELKLIRESQNQYDKYAVAVHRISGEQIGYLPAGDRRLADHMDMGGRVTARVVKILGGPRILGLFFKAFRKNYGCLIGISKGDFDWQEVTPYLNKSREIEDLIKIAKTMEARDPTNAIWMYRDAITQIVAFDSAGTVAAAWRRARYPINRLSLLLEKGGDFDGAYGEIVRYEQFNDVFGLRSDELESVMSRKERLAGKLGKLHVTQHH